jgi:hypothetical protein
MQKIEAALEQCLFLGRVEYREKPERLDEL